MLTELLKSLREAHNLTQEDVAKYLNVQRTTYTRYETGTNALNFYALCRLADLYKVSTDYLLERSSMNRVHIKPELIALYNNSDPIYRDIAIDILRKGQKKPNYSQICHEVCIPLLGEDTVILPIAMLEENVLDTPVQDEENVSAGDYAVIAKDDSMIGVGIEPGNYVILRPQGKIDNGEVGLVYVKGQTYLRRIFENCEQVVLVPANEAYETEFHKGEEGIYFLGKMLKVIKDPMKVT